MRKQMFSAVMIVLALAATSMAATTIDLDGGKPQLTITEQKAAGLSYRVEVGQIQALDVATKGGEFTQLFIPGFHSSMVDGAPELPQMNRLFALPAGAQVRFDVRNVRTRTVRLADFGITNPVFPHQPSLSKSQSIDDVPFVYDSAAYAKSRVENELVRVEYQGRLRAVDIARLEIAPVRWLPASGELEIVESFDLELGFDRGWSESERLAAATESPFFDAVYEKIDGVRTSTIKSDLVQYPVKMVIITPPEFQAMLGDFIAWKTERGFEVITGVIGSPEVGSTTTTIEAYLQGLYDAGVPGDPAPSFVVFIGDVAQCPTFFQSGDATDRLYCECTGDLFPDMYYGRLSATNSSMLQAILDKTMMYDTYSMPDPSYLENVTLIAGVDSYWAPTHANGTIRYGEDYYYNVAHDINSYAYYYPESGSSEAAIMGNCNDGIGFINYTAHGSIGSWADPSMNISDINSMTNVGKYFLAIGNCCLTSTYDSAECFGEAFLRAPEKGAVGYIGGSNSTYWDEDVWWSVGSCPSSLIRDGMTYEETASGAYDAVFHDMPNEVNDPSTWYVTNDAIVFRGNLAVSEAGSSRETYYWNIYNLLGDPSVAAYMGRPVANEMTYPETVFVGVPSMTVTGAWGTYIGCSQDGELVGTGLVGQDGTAEVTFNRILTPGVPLKLVAMISTREPVITELNVIVPADVSFDPQVIDANVPTQVTVTVMEEDGTTPKPGINVWAEGLEYATAPVMTNAAGVAVITVDYAYGPSVDIVGQDPDDSYRLFTEPLEVNALALGMPDLSVTTDIGMNDMFPLNLPGTLHATASQAGTSLYALLPGGSLQGAVGTQLTVTATEPGQVLGMIALSGYDLYTEAFDVIEAYGTVAGTVTSGGSAMSGVTVNLVDDQDSVVMSAVTDAYGNWELQDEVLVDDYSLVVDHFGYLHYEQAVFVNYGANTFDIALDPAPAGVLTGHVYDEDTMEPLQATVKIYRPDTGELYNEVICDESGLYTTANLPYFTYEVKVRAWHHVPVTSSVIIDTPSLEKDWVLAPTNGDLLLIDDTAKAAVPAKYTEKGELLAPAYVQDGAKSITELTADLEELGYYVSLADAGTVDPATFWDYDLVILACGDNTSTLGNSALKNGLVQFAQEGGHILLEGGELGYDQYGSGDFATYVMHSNDWNHDSAGSIAVGATSHYVATYPNNLANSTISLTYSGYGDSDGMVPLPDAELVAAWSEYASEFSVMAYDTNPAPEGGQIVFFSFNYAAAGAERVDLLENAVLWLLTPELGDCSVSGTVTLSGMSDHSGITVRALPSGPSTVTSSDGSYQLDGLFAGPYTIMATKEGWSVGTVDVVTEQGVDLTGIDMELQPVTVSEFCDAPGAPIYDNQTTIVTMDLPMQPGITVSQLEVFLDITHTYQGDLVVTVTAPDQTAVVLHNRTGGTTDNIYGWYPDELTPAESLELMAGCEIAGTWTLSVQDMAGGDQGVINEWCLRITHAAGDITGIDDGAGVPMAFRSYPNYPNPFNPITNIKFDLPRAGKVSLRVYDLAGRLVRELVNAELPAASHTVRWDGTDGSGRRVASGVYYYRLTTPTNAATHKMALVK